MSDLKSFGPAKRLSFANGSHRVRFGGASHSLLSSRGGGEREGRPRHPALDTPPPAPAVAPRRAAWAGST